VASGLIALALWLGQRLAAHRAAVVLACSALALAVAHTLLLADRLRLVAWVPWLGMIFLALSLPLPLLTLFLRLLWPRLTGSVLRRLCLTAPLALLALWLALGSFVGEPPATTATLPDAQGVVHQSSEASCSAASTATLLAAAKLPATEPELATLCLTRATGTPLLGVYRGLRLKTNGTPWQVRVLSGASVEALHVATQSGPVLISVGLDRWQHGYDPRYVTEWGWTPGKRHAVVVFGFLPGGKLDIGDPSVGREQWSQEALAVLWNGEGIQLVRG
jgi:hypothetical protein